MSKYCVFAKNGKKEIKSEFSVKSVIFLHDMIEHLEMHKHVKIKGSKFWGLAVVGGLGFRGGITS
jgi:hypothetical protein